MKMFMVECKFGELHCVKANSIEEAEEKACVFCSPINTFEMTEEEIKYWVDGHKVEVY